MRKSSILLAGTRKIISVACGFSPIKIHFSDSPKSLISRINIVYLSLNKVSLLKYFIEKNNNIKFIYNRLFCCNHTCYGVGMVYLTSASPYVTSASRYQRRSSMYIRSLLPGKSMELAEADSIDFWLSLYQLPYFVYECCEDSRGILVMLAFVACTGSIYLIICFALAAILSTNSLSTWGAQWLSHGYGPMGYGFETPRHHCAVFLSKTH